MVLDGVRMWCHFTFTCQVDLGVDVPLFQSEVHQKTFNGDEETKEKGRGRMETFFSIC